MTAVAERAVAFPCAEAERGGILHRPAAAARRGVLIVVGGPQYRAGSHRQFLLIARLLAEQGYPVLRFDHLRIGARDGTYLGFEAPEADIAAAIDALVAHSPPYDGVVRMGHRVYASALLFSY